MSRGHYIKGKWLLGEGSSFSSYDPATEETLWEGKEATKAEVVKATAAAKEAFPKWSALPFEKRLKYLRHFCSLLGQEREELERLISQENGKPLWESKIEVNGLLGKLDLSVDAYQKRSGENVQELPLAQLATRHRPHGVMAVFGPFNFPAHLPNGHIIPALLAGNTVVFKPSELTPAVAEFLVKVWEQSGIPAGVINLVQGGSSTGKLLLEDEIIDGVLFTGSWKTGQAFSKYFGNHPEKILALEMGGNNPLVVWDAGDAKAAAYLTIQSAFISSGQRCTCARRLVLPEGTRASAYLKCLLEMTKTLKIGHFKETPEPFCGPMITPQSAQAVYDTYLALLQKGAVPLIPMDPPEGAYLRPGILDVTELSERPDIETFGPLLQVIRVSTFEAAITEANNTSYGLSAGCITDNEETFRQFYQNVKAGVINWNTQLTGASSAAPFGGQGHSGNQRPSAYYAADYCSYPVASMESCCLTLPESLYPGVKI